MAHVGHAGHSRAAPGGDQAVHQPGLCEKMHQGRVVKTLALQRMLGGLRLLNFSRLSYLGSLQGGFSHLGGVWSLLRRGLLVDICPEYDAVKTGLDLGVQEVVEVVAEEKIQQDGERVGLGQGLVEAGGVGVEKCGQEFGDGQAGPAQRHRQHPGSRGDGGLVGGGQQEGGQLGQAGNERLDSGGHHRLLSLNVGQTVDRVLLAAVRIESSLGRGPPHLQQRHEDLHAIDQAGLYRGTVQHVTQQSLHRLLALSRHQERVEEFLRGRRDELTVSAAPDDLHQQLPGIVVLLANLEGGLAVLFDTSALWGREEGEYSLYQFLLVQPLELERLGLTGRWEKSYRQNVLLVLSAVNTGDQS